MHTRGSTDGDTDYSPAVCHCRRHCMMKDRWLMAWASVCPYAFGVASGLSSASGGHLEIAGHKGSRSDNLPSL